MREKLFLLFYTFFILSATIGLYSLVVFESWIIYGTCIMGIFLTLMNIDRVKTAMKVAELY